MDKQIGIAENSRVLTVDKTGHNKTVLVQHLRPFDVLVNERGALVELLGVKRRSRGDRFRSLPPKDKLYFERSEGLLVKKDQKIWGDPHANDLQTPVRSAFVLVTERPEFVLVEGYHVETCSAAASESKSWG